MNKAAIIILLLAAAAVAQGGTILTVGDVTYEDVQLKKEYPASFFIQHKDGMVFVEKSELTEEQIASIKNFEEPAAKPIRPRSWPCSKKIRRWPGLSSKVRPIR